jgi:hypothetical protein
MKKILIPFIMTVCLLSFSDEIEFTDGIMSKPAVSFSDGVTMFCYMYKIPVQKDFDSNVSGLRNKVRYFPKKFTSETYFTVGDFSLFAMQYLGIESGLFYLATHSGRYAARELMIRNIIPFNTSEYEKISGQDLMTLVQKVVDYEHK